MATKQHLEAQNPLILRCNRLMEAFAKSDDERDFYLDRSEGFIIYVDLDKPEEDLELLENELIVKKERYCLIPKLTFYETKKIMEGFIHEKVYDIDTKEKLLDIIQSKEAREHFLEFIYDHHSELEKWQIFYQERSRIRIIEWLRANHFHFVFEEDLDLPRMIIEKLKKDLFQTKVGKDLLTSRKVLFAKAKTYYSNEALNPRPKRGRPPKQTQKIEVEPQISTDIYTTVPNGLMVFLFIPDLTNPASSSFSSKFGSEGDIFTARRSTTEDDLSLESINTKLKEFKTLSSTWKKPEGEKEKTARNISSKDETNFDEDDDDDSFEEDEDKDAFPAKKSSKGSILAKSQAAKQPKIADKTTSKPSKLITKNKKEPAKTNQIQNPSSSKIKPAASAPKTKVKSAPKLGSKSSKSLLKSDKKIEKKPKALRPMLKLKKKN